MTLMLLAWAICLTCLLLLFLVSYRGFAARASLPGSRSHPAPRLSRDPSLMRPQYDVVVIGSGYGGGVAAARMARTGKSVCVLERGEERWPRDYPASWKAALREFHLQDRRPGRRRSLGKRLGLYQMCKGEGQYVVSGCALGGTSVVNAGVWLPADKRVFEAPQWPAEIRKNTRDLDQYFRKAECMFQPAPYPEHMPKPLKMTVFEKQVSSLGLRNFLYRPPLTTSFQSCVNGAGVEMQPSTSSGNECTGANDGSKNSVLATYIADAWTWGAEIFCGIDVKYLHKLDPGEGYIVFYELSDNHLEKRRLLWVHAKELVILGGGALGSTEILLRSRSYGLSTSPLLGQRLSGNGDLLAFAYNSNEDVNSIGREALLPTSHSICGPTISLCLDLRDTEEISDARDGFVIQEGAVPQALGRVLQAILETRTRLSRPLKKPRLLAKSIARLRSWIHGPYHALGSIQRTAVYLVMSHDENEGTMEMENGAITLHWSGIGVELRNKRVQNLLSKATASIGGMLVNTPSVTVHPLGGACMSNDSTGSRGVVNHIGQVYSGLGSEIHEGLLCMDASIIPTSLGVNPCATITTLAERCCDWITHQKGWSTDKRPNEPLDLFGEPYRSNPPSLDLQAREEQLKLNQISGGLKFDETLHGFLYATQDDCSFNAAAKIAESTSSYARLSVGVELYRSMETTYEGAATGTLSYSVLSRDPLLITRSSVKFFTVDPDVSDAVNLVYDLRLRRTDGAIFNFRGYKTIDPGIAFSIAKTWTTATTLFTTISTSDGGLVAKGILKLSLKDFAYQLLSLRCKKGTKFSRRCLYTLHFLTFFARGILPYMLGPWRTLIYNDIECDNVRYINKLKPVETYVTSADGVQICIKMWEPDARTTAMRTPVVLIPGASVDDQIFSLPTIPANTIDYLTSQGHRCYVPVLRFGICDEAKNGWTVFDARLDVRAALQYVRRKEGNKPLYAIVHCLGSIVTATALLHGDIEASWFSGLACSQVFTDLIYSKDNNFKAGKPVLIKTYEKLAGDWFSCRSPSTAPWIQILLDQILRIYPVGSRKELCNSAVCHRCNLPFGRCWSHANLNHATHARLGEYFDGIHMNFLTHLSRMGATSPQHVRTNLPEFADLMTSASMAKFEGLKICFLSGGDNAVWKPDATKKSFDMFRERFPHGDYERVVVPGYGHLDCWIGKNAHEDVYPRIVHHIQHCEIKGQVL